MPLVVIAGLPGEGLSQRMREVASRAVSEGSGASLVVPGSADAVKARRSLAGEAPVGVRVATLDGLIQAEWALTGDGRRLVSGLARDVLLARALVSSGVAEHPGRGMVGLLGMLVDRAPARLARAVSGKGTPDRIVAALDTYRVLLSRLGMVEGRDVCALIAGAPPSAVMAVDGFTDLRPEHEVLLDGWSAAGADVFVSLPWKPDCPGTAATTPLVDRLRARGATVSQAAAVECPRGPELMRVRSELFAGAVPAPGTGAVSLAVTEGEEAEARHIATVVVGLISSGAPPETIAIAFADPSRRAGWLARTLRDLGVSADVEASMAVGETALGGALLRLRACAANGLERDDLTALMRTRFSGIPTERADAAEAAWRGAGPIRGRRLLRNVREMDFLVEGALELRGLPIGAGQARKWKNLADRMLVNANPGPAPVPDEDERIYAAVHRAFCGCLQEALELGDGEVSADEFWDRFSGMRVAGHVGRRPGRVLVTSVDAVPSGDFAHVIIGGLSAAEIPRRGSEDRLEGDSVSRAMLRLGIDVDPEDHALKERRAFYLAAIGASESLTLTRQGTSDEGTAVRESVFWDEFLDLYRVPGELLPVGSPPVMSLVTADTCGAAGRPRVSRGGSLDQESLEQLRAVPELSPSQIETYVACPYKWFVQQKIRATALDETVDRAAAGLLAHDALARFYREWRTRAPRVTPDTLDAAVAVAAEAMAAAARAFRQPETLEEVALLESVGPSVIALVGRDADFLPDYAPEHVEWEFGGSSGVPAVDIGGVCLKGRSDRIDVGPEGLVVVDYKRTNASSLKHIERDGLVQLQLYAIAASRVLGIPVAGGLYRSLKDGSDRGFVLSGVSGSFKSADVVERDRLDALLESAIEQARRVAGEMREGRIEATPSADACRYCAASGFCSKAVTA
jgi:RecB family exonuclease